MKGDRLHEIITSAILFAHSLAYYDLTAYFTSNATVSSSRVHGASDEYYNYLRGSLASHGD